MVGQPWEGEVRKGDGEGDEPASAVAGVAAVEGERRRHQVDESTNLHTSRRKSEKENSVACFSWKM
jgi:hypothetical protein